MIEIKNQNFTIDGHMTVNFHGDDYPIPASYKTCIHNCNLIPGQHFDEIQLTGPMHPHRVDQARLYIVLKECDVEKPNTIYSRGVEIVPC